MTQNGKRIAFVAGGSGAIGADICRALVADGFAVAIGYCTQRERAEELADRVSAAGGTSIAVRCDITEYASVLQAKEEVQNRIGNVDTLVNCAGTEAYRLLCDETEKSIAHTIAANLTGNIFLCRVFSPDMVRMRFGRIVNLSSVWGVSGAAMETVYSAAKAGLIGFSKALALELAPSLVTVNAVSPGFIDTPMNARFSDAERQAIIDEIPACRFGLPADVSAAVRFIVSESASYLTGQNIVVSGGYKNI